MTIPTTAIRVGLAVVFVATALSGCGTETTLEITPSAIAPTASDEASPSPRSEAVVIPEVVAASEIPWDEVGPGWFVLGFDRGRSEPTEYESGWDLSSGEIWFLSPTGEAFQGPKSPADAFGLTFWSGSEVWFTVPFNTEPDDPGCEFIGCVDTVAIDVLTGAVRHPLVSPYWPERVELTADGSYLETTGCCDFGEAMLVGADGAETPFDLVVTLMTPSLTPDGMAVVWIDVDSNGPNLPIVRTFFNGEEERTALPQESGWMAGWIDESTVLLRLFTVDDDYTVSDEQWLAFDFDSGRTSTWVPPVEEIDSMYSPATGWWLWESPEGSNSILTDSDGSFRISLECVGGYCEPFVSGDRLLWVDRQDPSAGDSEASESDGRQRLTLVDLTTGNQTVILDVPGADGHIVDVQPHARVYE